VQGQLPTTSSTSISNPCWLYGQATKIGCQTNEARAQNASVQNARLSCEVMSDELYNYLCRMKVADQPLISKWRKTGYENLCSLLAIQKVGPHRPCSPRHRNAFNSRNE